MQSIAFAQTPQYAYRISFTDKAGSPDLSNPLLYLSQRSLDRRTAQNIGLDATDQPVSPVYLNEVLTLTNGKLHVVSKWLNQCVILVENQADINTIQGKPYISGIKYISYFPQGLHQMAPEINDKTDEPFIPPFSANKITGGIDHYGAAFEQTDAVMGYYLHDHGYKGEGKLIAVFDGGFRHMNTNPVFSDLMQPNRLVDKFNFVLANDDVFNFDTHGTNAISAMAVNVPGTYVGSAPNAQYAIYVTEAAGEREIEMDNLLAAAERSDSIGADIISVSLGYNTFDAPLAQNSLVYAELDGKTTIAAKAANIATSKGMLFVTSAGNEGGNSWNYILTPGDADSALTIGSVNINRQVAGNSGYGPNAAGHIKPDVCAVGSPAAVMSSGANALYINGTSFAVPQIAGWAACLWQSVSKGNPYRIKRAIIESAHAYNNPDNHMGHGVPNFYNSVVLLSVDDVPPIPNEENWVQVYPSPFTEELRMDLYQPFKEVLSITLSDMTGKIVYRDEQNLSRGRYFVKLPIPSLAPGNYVLNITSGTRTMKQQVVRR
jgi:hypothetical protein